MADTLFIFLIVLALAAAAMRADFVLTLIYMLLGVYLAGRWWNRRAQEAVRFKRAFNRRVFLGEQVPVRLDVENTSWLPVVWLHLNESLPQELLLSGVQRQVLSLGPHEKSSLHYLLEGRRRGYYPVGPLLTRTGDLFGLAGEEEKRYGAEHLTVYPKIIPFTRVRLPSRSPMGTLKHTQPQFEDPSRVTGKRDYVSGDSLRRVDWKATAASGRLQVKLFEPSIALETMIFLNLNTAEYESRSRLDASELGIVVAASLANWVIGQRQSVGLATNGSDPLLGRDARPGVRGMAPDLVPPGRGRAHLMRVLDVLARVQLAESCPLVELLGRELVNLPWGTSLILITSHFDDALFDGLFQARRAGMSAVLLPCGPFPAAREARHRAETFGFPYYEVLGERDLDPWRK